MTTKTGYSISDISAIKSLPTASLTNGYARLCRSVNAWFSYNSTSTTTADDISVLLPASGIGRWFKLKADIAATDVVNFNEAVDDRVAVLVQNSSTISASYNDAANTLTFSVVGASIGDTQVSSLSQSKITNLTSDLASKLSANQNITISGDATGSGATSITLTLANTGVNAGSYTNPTLNIDSKGRITSATNGTSLSNPMTATGDLIVGGNSGVATRFPPNNTTEKKYLSQYVEVGSSTPWTPSNTTTQLWLDASDNSTITLVSGAASEWRDKSGNARHATQGTSANRPTILTANLNGLNVLAFDGVNDSMTTSNVFTSASDVSIFAVHMATGIDADGRALMSLWNTSVDAMNGYFHAIARTNLTNGFRNAFSTNQDVANIVVINPPTALTLNNWDISGHGRSASNQFLSWNGANQQISATNQCNFVNAKAVIGNYYSFSPAYFWQGRVAEIVLLNSYASTDIRQKLEGYLAHKWGLTANLPSNHPYKTNAPTTSGTASQIVTQWDTVPLEDSGVVAGSYSNANITVDAKGRVTAASEGTESIQDAIASTLVAGTNISLNYNDTAGTLTINSTAVSSGTNVEIRNEGVTLTSATTSLNFVGNGVTATNTGGDVTVTIPYSGKSGYEVISSKLSIPLVFYWDDYHALPVNYVTRDRFSVVGTEPLRGLLNSTTGLRFLGASNGHYAISNSTALQITGDITYFAVIQTGVIPSTNSLGLQGILAKQTGTANGISLNILNSNFYVEFTNNSGTTFSIISSVTLTSNTKYIVLMYRNGANCYLNVNGTVNSINTFTGTNIVQNDPLRVGNKTASNFGFEGIIQMAGICNGSVNSTDITFLLGLDYERFPYL